MLHRPRVLYILRNLPWPFLRNGNGQRTELILRSLKQIADVELFVVNLVLDPTLLTDDGQRIPDEIRTELNIRREMSITGWPPIKTGFPGFLGRFEKTVKHYHKLYQPQTPALQWLLEQDSQRKYDLIVGRYLRPTMLAGAAKQSIPVILDLDDVDYQTFVAEISFNPWKGPNGWLASKVVSGMLYLKCREATKRFAHVWVTNLRDHLLLGSTPKVSVLPNIPFAPPGRPITPCVESTHARPRILFVGALDYKPNVQGIQLFLRDVWPGLVLRHPGVSLEIVGTGLSNELSGSFKTIPGIEVTGFVENISEAYERADLTIAPVFWGGGTNIKVLESFAYGRVCVGTSFSMGTYNLPVGVDSKIMASESGQMGNLLSTLLKDTDTRRNMARQLRDWTNLYFSYETFEKEVIATVEMVLKNTRSKGSLA